MSDVFIPAVEQVPVLEPGESVESVPTVLLKRDPVFDGKCLDLMHNLGARHPWQVVLGDSLERPAAVVMPPCENMWKLQT